MGAYKDDAVLMLQWAFSRMGCISSLAGSFLRAGENCGDTLFLPRSCRGGWLRGSTNKAYAGLTQNGMENDMSYDSGRLEKLVDRLYICKTNDFMTLEKKILDASKAYYLGEPTVSDPEFDSWVMALKKLYPDSPVLRHLS
jgi:hypothetical protein